MKRIPGMRVRVSDEADLLLALTFVSTDIPSLPPLPQDERHKKPSDCMTAHGSDPRVAPASSSLPRQSE
jgi:hypothetical protein